MKSVSLAVAQRPPAPGNAPRTRNRRKLVRIAEAYAYLTPTLIGLIVASAGAVVASFVISFAQWDIILPPRWVGLRNYVQILRSPLSWRIFGNTFYYTLLFVPLSTLASIPLAILVNQKLGGVVFFRTMYFLPVVSASAAIVMVWAWMYQPQFGMINFLLKAVFGIKGPNWLGKEWAMPSIIIIGVWHSLGSPMMIYLAGLQGIPEELYEAARIDGAGSWRLFRHITMPMLTPSVFFVLITSIIGSFQVFEAAYLMTQGGPAYATTTISYWIFQNAFQWFHMGYAAALAYILFAIIMIVTLLQFRFQAHWVFYG